MATLSAKQAAGTASHLAARSPLRPSASGVPGCAFPLSLAGAFPAGASLPHDETASLCLAALEQTLPPPAFAELTAAVVSAARGAHVPPWAAFRDAFWSCFAGAPSPPAAAASSSSPRGEDAGRATLLHRTHVRLANGASRHTRGGGLAGRLSEITRGDPM